MQYMSPEDQARGFRIHAIVFVPTLIALAIVNYFTGAPYWVLWVVLGWGIGLLSHWAFVIGPFRSKAASNAQSR